MFSVALAVCATAISGCRRSATPSGDAEAIDAAGQPSSGDANAGAGAEPPAQDGGPSRLVAALRFETSVFSRPEFTPRGQGSGGDERTGVVRLGTLRKGQRAEVKPDVVKTASCPEGWFELVQGGYVCGRFVTEDLDAKELKVFPHAPYDDRPLPYEYGLNLTNGTPMYRRPPLRRERESYEKGLVAVGQSEEDRASAAKEAAAANGQTPWYLKDNLDKSSVTLDDLKGESGLVELRMVRGFYLALDQEVRSHAGKFWRTVRGDYVPVEHVLVHQSKTEFEGVWFGKEGETRKLPLGFSLRPKARKYQFPTPGQAPVHGEKLPRFTIVGLTGNEVLEEKRKYYETTDAWWLRDLDGTITRPGPPPPDLAEGEKWIDVNVTTQTLVAYEGTRAVFATLVSSGRRDEADASKDHPTPTGSFRIREKHVATTMDDDTATDGPYSIEEVPWVMYFERSYALHGAFWHSQFGHEHSHGCVNMTPHDAKELFAWVGPALPAGWQSVRATASNPGTRVVVHE
jgi:hypothetical protein